MALLSIFNTQNEARSKRIPFFGTPFRAAIEDENGVLLLERPYQIHRIAHRRKYRGLKAENAK